jgi:hypothetical protein
LQFFDDDNDIPILLFGRAVTPMSGLYDYGLSEEKSSSTTSGSTGLFQACGAPSQGHAELLKRSARYAMSLLRYLVCDHREFINVKTVCTIAIECAVV